MSENTSTATAPAKTIEKGTWQETLTKAATLAKRSDDAKKKATTLLWEGAQEGITQWLPGSDDDVSAEALYSEVIDLLGKPRKGDASKIKTVAVAVKTKGLVMSVYPSLTQAYNEARSLLVEAKKNEIEDEAAEKAIEAIEVPKSTTTIEGAAAILLGKGIDGAVVAILDALGADNEAAHRSFMRAVSTEVSSRVTAKAQAERDAKQAAAKAVADAKKAEREAEKAKREAERAAKKAAAKPKAATTKAKAPAKSGTKATPKAPPKAAPRAKAKPKAAPAKAVTEAQNVAAQALEEMAEERGVTPVSKVESNIGQTKARPVIKRPVKA